MGSRIKIYRGAAQLADGASSLVEGCPLADCTRAMEVFPLINAAMVRVADYGNLSNALNLRISNEFSTGARAMNHALLGPQNSVGQANLVIVLEDEDGTHTWTISDGGNEGAAWKQAKAVECTGVRAVLEYPVEGGAFAYTGPITPSTVAAPGFIGLPTADPGVNGAVWNNGGVLCLSSTGPTPVNITFSALTLTGLGTSDPAATGSLWNNGGVLCVSGSGSTVATSLYYAPSLADVPTADPALAGRVWSNGGMLCVSAG